MEVLPHEIRILYDSNVVRRIPDRLVPPGSQYYDYATNYVRTRMALLPGEFDIDLDSYIDSLEVSHVDSLGQVPGTLTNKERTYFEAHVNDCAGCWPDKNGHPAAHHRLDYIKIWDVPSDMKISDYQQ